MMNAPRLLLDRCPRLFPITSTGRPYPLPVGVGAAHILIHFLWTGTYESIQPKGDTCEQRLASEFSTNIQIYKLARDNRLNALEDHAKFELEILGERLSCTTITDLVCNEYPRGTGDVWIIKFLKSKLESVLRNPGRSLDFVSSNNEWQSRSINSILITCLRELIGDHFLLKQQRAQTQDGPIEESASRGRSHEPGCSKPGEAEISGMSDTNYIGGVIELSQSDSSSSITAQSDLPERSNKKKKKGKRKDIVTPASEEASVASSDWGGCDFERDNPCHYTELL
jgi:hypothetical protein